MTKRAAAAYFVDGQIIIYILQEDMNVVTLTALQPYSWENINFPFKDPSDMSPFLEIMSIITENWGTINEWHTMHFWMK